MSLPLYFSAKEKPEVNVVHAASCQRVSLFICTGRLGGCARYLLLYASVGRIDIRLAEVEHLPLVPWGAVWAADALWGAAGFWEVVRRPVERRGTECGTEPHAALGNLDVVTAQK